MLEVGGGEVNARPAWMGESPWQVLPAPLTLSQGIARVRIAEKYRLAG
jgi:hypothetical protein